MKDGALISIIVPVYNVKQYLETCIYSLIYQTYSNIEIIIVDDGSTDGSGEICDELATVDTRIKVIHKVNGGLSDARNAGIDVATGVLLGFVDSDDWVSTRLYETLFSNLTKHEADVAVCERVVVYDDRIVDLGLTKTIAVKNTYDALDLLYENKKYGSHAWNKLYKRELFDNIRFPKGKLYEDVYIMHDIFGLAQNVVFIDEGLYFYRQRQGSIVNSSNLDYWQDYIEAIKFRGKSHHSRGREKLVYTNLLYAAETIKEEILKCKKDDKSVKLTKYVNNSIRSGFSFRYGIKMSVKALFIKDGYTIFRFLKKVRNSNRINQILLKVSGFNIGKSSKRRVILMGTPEYNNLGDLAIGYSIKAFFDNEFPLYEFIEVPEKFLCGGVLPKGIKDKDLLVLIGGGNLGDSYMDQQNIRKFVLSHYKNNNVIIFPQTAFFSDSIKGNKELQAIKKLLEKRDNTIIFLREKYSYDLMKKEVSSSNCYLCPDIVLYNTFSYEVSRNGILCCLRSDKESILLVQEREKLIRDLYVVDNRLDLWDTCLPYNIELKRRTEEVEKAIKYVAAHKLIITDRLHGVIFAAISGTPCIAIGNYNYKVIGIYEWLKELPHIQYVENMETVITKTVELLKKFPEGSNQRIDDNKFEILIKKVKDSLI